MITIGNYRKAESLEEAWQLNQKRSSRIIGGMVWLKLGHGTVQTVIDLSGLGLDTIEESETEFRIGCMVTLRDLELHAGMDAYTDGAMKEALKSIVGVQFRNVATVGGSIYGRFGFSDVLTMFMAMDSYVELYKGGMCSLREFAAKKADRDILVRVIVKKEKARYVYQSVRNSRTDFPVLTCAAARNDAGQLRLAYGARPGRAVLLEPEEQAKHSDVSMEDYAAGQIVTGSNLRGSAAYRSQLVRVLTKRALSRLGGAANAD